MGIVATIGSEDDELSVPADPPDPEAEMLAGLASRSTTLG